MLTKSITLTEDEAAALQRYLDLTGEEEATVLKRAALRGLGKMRIERALLAYLEVRDWRLRRRSRGCLAPPSCKCLWTGG